MISRNENTAELVGLSLGDGGLTYRYNTNRMRFQLRGHLREDKEHYDDYIVPLFNREVMFPIFNRKVGLVYNKNKTFYGLSVESIKIEKPLNYIGIPSGKKRELSIPSWIKKNKSFSKRFLRGYFDTDGSISCEKNYSIRNPKYHNKIKIHIGSTSSNIIREMKKVLDDLGIKNFIKKPYKPKQKNYKISHRLVIDGGINVDKWFKIVGSKNSKHITKYKIWKKFGFCPPLTNLKERRKILKGKINPSSYYKRGSAGAVKRARKIYKPKFLANLRS